MYTLLIIVWRDLMGRHPLMILCYLRFLGQLFGDQEQVFGSSFQVIGTGARD